MMRVIKRLERNGTALLVGLALVFGGQLTQAQQVRSDFEIQKDFKQEIKSINVSLDSVGSVAGADQVVDRVKSLERNYADHEELLNKVLYPETFDTRLEELKKRTVSVRQRVAKIEEQNTRLTELNTQLAFYDYRLSELNSQTDSLQTAMSKSVRSEKELSSQVRRYRRNLEQRDELILSIIDSVLVAYRDINIESLQNLETTPSREQINSGDNPINLIESIANENVQILNSNPNLAAGDYLRMNAVQQEFVTMWNRVGVKLADVYSDNPDETREKIEASIQQWGEEVNNGLWISMHQSFEQAGIEMSEFGNSEELTTALNNYVNQGISGSRQNTTKQDRKKFQEFSTFWNERVKAEWGEFLARGEVLSTQKMASIDQKLDQWSGLARPESNTFAYLFGLSMLAVVVLGVMLFREKTGNGNGNGSTVSSESSVSKSSSKS